MLPVTLQFIVAMLAHAINDRMARRVVPQHARPPLDSRARRRAARIVQARGSAWSGLESAGDPRVGLMPANGSTDCSPQNRQRPRRRRVRVVCRLEEQLGQWLRPVARTTG